MSFIYKNYNITSLLLILSTLRAVGFSGLRLFCFGHLHSFFHLICFASLCFACLCFGRLRFAIRHVRCLLEFIYIWTKISKISTNNKIPAWLRHCMHSYLCTRDFTGWDFETIPHYDITLYMLSQKPTSCRKPVIPVTR